MKHSAAVDPSISAPGVRLRPMCSHDRELYVLLYADPQVMRHIARARTRDEAHAGFDRVLALQHRQPELPPRWIVTRSAPGEDLGLLALISDASGDTAEVGIMLIPSAQGRGWATTALSLAVQSAFEHRRLVSLWARHRAANAAMARVLGALGFVRQEEEAAEVRWHLTASEWSRRCSLAAR